MKTTRALLVISAIAGGCASMFIPVEQQPDFGRYFTMSLLGDTEQARVDGARLHGADLEVSREPDGYRGTGRSGPIDLRTSSRKIVGMVGTGSTELFVDGNQGTLHIQGRFAEKTLKAKVFSVCSLTSISSAPPLVHSGITSWNALSDGPPGAAAAKARACSMAERRTDSAMVFLATSSPWLAFRVS